MAGRRGRPWGLAREPEWSEVCGLFHMRIKDAATVLDVSVIRLRHLCRKNGVPQWPGKKIRYRNSIEKRAAALGIEVPVGSPPLPGSAGSSSDQVDKILETEKVEDDDMVGIQEPDPPRELITLNLIDKVGSSRG